ncbi:type II secretion system F family protein [archaeon]|nr:type II secretion system F family protein [archaeon]
MIYRLLARIYPKKMREAYTQTLKYLNIKINPETYLGFALLMGLLVSLGGAFIVGTFYYSRIPILLMWPVLFILVEVLIYVPLMLKVDRNAKTIETILPDALQIMSSNLKSGLTIDQALLSSARQEFGIFAKELNRIGKEVAIGVPVETALINSTKRIKSEKYRKTMELIASGLMSGGEMAKLLDQTSINLKHQSLVDEKVRSNVMMYVIFIFFAICFGSPVLYGLSSYLVEVIANIFSQIDIPSTATSKMTLPIMQFSKASLSSEFVNTYIITSIILSCTMGSFIIGSISKGREKDGFKYLPLLLIISILVFVVVRAIISGLMGSLVDL